MEPHRAKSIPPSHSMVMVTLISQSLNSLGKVSHGSSVTLKSVAE